MSFCMLHACSLHTAYVFSARSMHIFSAHSVHTLHALCALSVHTARTISVLTLCLLFLHKLCTLFLSAPCLPACTVRACSLCTLCACSPRVLCAHTLCRLCVGSLCACSVYAPSAHPMHVRVCSPCAPHPAPQPGPSSNTPAPLAGRQGAAPAEINTKLVTSRRAPHHPSTPGGAVHVFPTTAASSGTDLQGAAFLLLPDGGDAGGPQKAWGGAGARG